MQRLAVVVEKGDADLFCRPGPEKSRGSSFGISREQSRQKTRLQREIEATDRQTDQVVYELYGLTGIWGLA